VGVFLVLIFGAVVSLVGSTASASNSCASSVNAWVEPDEPAYVPGFEVPTEFAKKRVPEPVCGGAMGYVTCFKSDTHYGEYYKNGVLLGQVRSSFSNRSDALFISKIYVNEASRRQGIATELMRRALEACPLPPQRVEADLAHTNYEFFVRGYHAVTSPKSPARRRGISVDEANRLAVQTTPFVRSWKRLGYSSIAEVRTEWVNTELSGQDPGVIGIYVVLRK
jgi:hypothetical protein